MPRTDMRVAVKRSPVDKQGKRLCWGYSTHRGCPFKAGECNQSHTQITTLRGLDWRVAASLIRHGGLKTGKPITPSEVNGRIKQLREQAKVEEDAKHQPPKASGRLDSPPGLETMLSTGSQPSQSQACSKVDEEEELLEPGVSVSPPSSRADQTVASDSVGFKPAPQAQTMATAVESDQVRNSVDSVGLSV